MFKLLKKIEFKDEENKMKYEYMVKESSQDTREFKVVSNKKLNRNEIIEAISCSSLNLYSIDVTRLNNNKKVIKTSYNGTEQGDDPIIEIDQFYYKRKETIK